MPAGLMSNQALTQKIDSIEIFKRMQKSRQKFATIFPLILLREFWFCLLVQIAQRGPYESIFS